VGRITRKTACATLALASLLPGHGFGETSAASQLAQEEVFLDVLPQFELPDDVQPIPGAVNEEFRHCRELWPAGYELARSGPESRALRDIYGLIRTRNVIVSRNCTCSAKVANWEDVDRVATALRTETGVRQLDWRHTREIAAEAGRLTAIAEAMCGGPF
jgi:hypothetical protein